MVSEKYECLAVDLGASSGRVMAACVDEGRIELREVNRFVNEPVLREGTLTWDYQGLFDQICQGIRKATASGIEWQTIGIDTWGVDFGLLGANGELLAPPVHYRDKRTEGMMERVFETVPPETIFAETGIQFMPINTLYQLAAVRRTNPELLERADRFLMMGDLFAWMLTGEANCEFTNATTTQLLNPLTRDWSDKLIEALELPRSIFPKVTEPGTVAGKLKPDIADSKSKRLVAVATHDTGSAVASVPSAEPRFAYLSCGTWSLLGTEVEEPVLSRKVLEYNFTNEGGVCGTWRLLKNIMGLWILQETRSQWKREGREYSWDEIAQMSNQAGERFRSLIDPDDPRFLSPGDMPGRIRKFCLESRQPPPESSEQIVCCILESLCLKYRVQLERLEDLAGHGLPVLHMVGGGIQDTVLCQWTANACERRVLAGPVEATALGNVGMQLLCEKRVGSLNEFRRLVAKSDNPVVYEPRNPAPWRQAMGRFRELLGP